MSIILNFLLLRLGYIKQQLALKIDTLLSAKLTPCTKSVLHNRSSASLEILHIFF